MLDWMLDFEGRGKQGRVRAKIKKLEGSLPEDDSDRDGIEGRTSPVRWPHMDPLMDV